MKWALLAAITVWLAVIALPDNNLHLVVCDVGQGDAILVSYKTTQMLVDGGPNSAVLKCLGDHMPFYDRRIEVVVLTHPQADHLNGLIDVLKRYTVLQFVKEPVENTTEGYKKLTKEIKRLRVPEVSVYAGDTIKFANFEFDVVSPSRCATPGRCEPGADLNDTAIVGKLSFGDFDALLTSDAGRIAPAEPADVLKVPHHGSKYGMTREWLRQVSPALAIISVGRKNSYGHPAPETLKLLRDEDIKILRTDLDGDIEVVPDGRGYWMR